MQLVYCDGRLLLFIYFILFFSFRPPLQRDAVCAHHENLRGCAEKIVKEAAIIILY